MTDPITPYQRISDTSKKAAREKDDAGTTVTQCRLLVALMSEKGAAGLCIFEAADHLTKRLGYEVVPGTASGRMSDLMSDDKCQRYFGCPALVEKSDIRRMNPHSGKTAGAYVLKSVSGPIPAKPVPVGHTGPGPEGNGGGDALKGLRDTPAASPMTESAYRKNVCGEYPSSGNPHESPDAYRTEMLESKTGRFIAKCGGRQQGKTEALRLMREAGQMDFGFGAQLRPVR